MTPQECIKRFESDPKWSEKERAKGLAICIAEIAKSAIEAHILWGFSQMICKHNKLELRDFDPKFFLDVNQNPDNYRDYR